MCVWRGEAMFSCYSLPPFLLLLYEADRGLGPNLLNLSPLVFLQYSYVMSISLEVGKTSGD